MKNGVGSFKSILITILIMSAPLFAQEIRAETTESGRGLVKERGRVSILNGNLVTDFGTLIRATSYLPTYPSIQKELSILGPGVLKEKWKAFMIEFGLNAIQIDYRTWKVGKVDPEEFTELIDLFVDWSAENNVYLILGYGNNPGTIDTKELKRFWNVFAPRYKDRTHVIFEVNNEPAELALKNWPQSTVELQGEMYTLIRNQAPNTHIIFFSVPNISGGDDAVKIIKSVTQIDYRNTSVGFHWYGGDLKTIDAIKKAGYPVVCTEFLSQKKDLTIDYVSLVDRIKKLEDANVGWIPHQPRIENLGQDFKYSIEKAGISWTPDFGNWPLPHVIHETSTN